VSEELVEPSENQDQIEICYDLMPETDAISVAELMKRNHRDPQKTPSKPGMHRQVPDDDL